MRKTVFWISAGLLGWTQLGYPLALALLARLLGVRSAAARPETSVSAGVSLIVAAHNEESVIAAKVENALALDWPREQIELIVCCDGCSDRTAALAREAGADVVLELPRGGKVRAQDAGVARASGELLAFADANSRWEPSALRELAGAFADPLVGYACGRVGFVRDDGVGGNANQEGLYWRYEMWLRGVESGLRSVTAGNGAIYMTRAASYIQVDPIMGHDLSFPFNMVKRGWRAVDVPSARALEKMVPTIEGEFARKRRMMGHTWPIVVRGGMCSPRGYDAGYAGMIFSHRVLRYLSPFLHLSVLASNVLLVAVSPFYALALVAQAALVGAAVLASRLPGVRALLVARYYVLTTASIAAGGWDWLRHGTSAGWDAAEGTR